MEKTTQMGGTAAIETTPAAATAATELTSTAAATATKPTPEITKENADRNEREKENREEKERRKGERRERKLGKLWRSFQKKRPLSYGEARSRALQQVEMDEKCQLKRQEDKADVTKNKEKPKRMEAPIPQIFYHIRDIGLLRPPKPMKKYPNMKYSLKYCEFHEDFGHSTTECFTLREEIESLILSGYLKEFVAGMREARKSAEQDKGKRVADGSPEREVPSGHKKCVYVQMIMGGPTLAGQSRRAIKGYGRSLSITTNIGREVNLNEWGTPKVPYHPLPILFTENDAEGISYPHDDTLVVTLKVATGKVARTLVDTSSSVDVIFKSAFDQLLIESPKITPYATPLIGFARDMVIPKGIITLAVTLGKVPHRVVHMIDFLIVDHPGAYNIILGRPFLVATKAVVSMYYLAMKVPAIHSSVGQHPSSLRATSPSDNALLAGHLKCNYARYTPRTSTVTYNLKSKPQQNLQWQRVVFKISGSALVGNCPNIDPKIAREVASACRLGVEVAIVLGGRNFFCGDSWLSDTGFDRPTAYQIGVEIELLLYWILNLSSGSGLDTFSAALSDPYSCKEPSHLEKGRVVIFGGIGAGTGNPLFTTDAAAALRASELNADAMVKGVSVNGIYDSHSGNGHVVPEHISYREAVSGNFTSMDTMAITYCEENGIPGCFGLPSNVGGSRKGNHHLKLQLPAGVVGPESLAFDCNGEGPYAGVSDGRILKWQDSKLGWTEFAITTPFRRLRRICDGTSSTILEPLCGRPLGIKFNPVTCDLYIADAYFGLMVVGRNGGPAKQLASSAERIPFRFTNALDIDPNTGVVYFTDSSMYFQRRQYPMLIESGDRSGRLLKYDPRNKQVTVLRRGLAFPNGVTLSNDKSFLLVAESDSRRILRFWVEGESVIYSPQPFAQVAQFPDNIETDRNGDFWVALNTKRGNDKTDLVAVKLDGSNGNVLDVLEGNKQNALDSVSEVEEHGGYLYAGSPVQPYVVVIKA
ncbi:protein STRICTOSIDINE SYNTHASE-LIKE 10 [Citrus sinensis]|nr:protein STRICTOSIDINE SYNTHASE-LIKE 10 [Citrus sinensis]